MWWISCWILAAMGVNVVEREGISFSHPARFILVGTMNPEEGDLRPQLLDRFAFSVDIHGILDKAKRVEIMRRNIAFEADPAAFQAKWAPKEQGLSNKIKTAQYLLDEVSYTQRDLTLIAELTSSMEVDGHRSDMVILKGARAQAAFDGRRRISPVDIGIAAELALPHRVKAGPFRKSGVGIETLNEKIDGLKALSTVTEYPEEDGDDGATPDESDKKSDPLAEGEVQPDISNEIPLVGEGQQDIFTTLDAHWWEGGQVMEASETFEPRQLDTPLDEMVRKQGGRRSQTRSKTKRGRYIAARHAPGDTSDLAFDATLRAAAPYQRKRQALKERNKVAFAVRSADFQKKIRMRKTANLILLWWMARGRWRYQSACRQPKRRFYPCLPMLINDATGWAGRFPKRPRDPGAFAHQLGGFGPARYGKHPHRWQDAPRGGFGDGL